MTDQELALQLQLRLHSLPPGLRRVAEHILANYEDIAFATSADIAKAAGTGEASVVRLAQALNFSGFLEMKERIRASIRRRNPQDQDAGAELKEPVERFFQNIAALPDILREDSAAQPYAKAGAALCAARSIHILGFGAAGLPARFLAQQFYCVLPGVRLHLEAGDALYLEFLDFGPQDALIGFFAAPLCQRTLEVMRFAGELGVVTLGFVAKPLYPAATGVAIPLEVTEAGVTTPDFSFFLAAHLLAAHIQSKTGLENESRKSRLEALRSRFK